MGPIDSGAIVRVEGDTRLFPQGLAEDVKVIIRPGSHKIAVGLVDDVGRAESMIRPVHILGMGKVGGGFTGIDGRAYDALGPVTGQEEEEGFAFVVLGIPNDVSIVGDEGGGLVV